VTEAIQRLGELGMLDDEAFATQWVESRDRARPRGERALRQELRQKGIDSETIARTLEERGSSDAGAGDGDEAGQTADEVAAQRLLDRHAGALGRISDPRARRQRTYALLARNGFDPEIAGRLANRPATAMDADAEPDRPD
jgi:regulatory protein